MRQMYLRCSDGDLFEDSVCPFDGWSLEGFDDAKLAAIRIMDKGEELSVARLQEEGVPESILKFVAVIEFGSDDAVFEALGPNGYLIKGS